MEIKLGLLGYGFMGHNHARKMLEYEQQGKLEFVALCDNDERQLADAPENVKIYRNMDELIGDPKINTILIAIPNHLHKEAVIKAANAGLNILCEKPAAMTVEDFDEMMAAVEKNHVRFTVHQQRRWDKDFRTAKEIYDQQKTGKVYTVQSKLYGFNGNMHDWHIYPEYGGGMLFDWGVHLLDQILWMIDAPLKTVYADVRNVINEQVDDYFKILLYFENGVTAEVELGTYFLSDKERWFEHHWFIGGDRGSYSSDGFSPDGKVITTSRLLTNVPGQITMTAAGPTRSFGKPDPDLLQIEEIPTANVNNMMYFDNFFKAMNGEEEFIVKPEQVRRVLRLMEVVRESAKLHQSIAFE
ncbi:MAG: Gfo/Idh/MocA family oxidoreductase [Lachnospiraceae bacterium]|nr:Gfo/Idh/MocA family oxidoreductase [Lachnospiraceae bacterium]